MLRQTLDELTADHLAQLVENGVEESRVLDFKEDYGHVDGRRRSLNDEKKRELLADVSSFANTGGGDLIIGMKEEAGRAISVIGLDLADPDAELLKIQNVIRDSLEPRISGLAAKSITLENGRVVLVIRTPRSWTAPHRVKPDSKFYARNSSGKYPMDVAELRQAFTLMEAISERMKRFRAERLATIGRGETSFPLMDGPLVIVHILPIVSFAAQPEIAFEMNEVGISPPGSPTGSRHTCYSLEGFVSAGGAVTDDGRHAGYGLLFRNGIVEAVNYIGDYQKKTNYIYATEVEQVLVYDVPSYLDRLKRENIDGPYYVLVSLVGVAGHNLHCGNDYGIRGSKNKAISSIFLLPEAVIGGTYDNRDAKKISDRMHNAFGMRQSLGFVEKGGMFELRP